jgi:hypothetical protein
LSVVSVSVASGVPQSVVSPSVVSRSLPIAEHEQGSGERVLLQRLPTELGQAIDPATEIDRLCTVRTAGRRPKSASEE